MIAASVVKDIDDTTSPQNIGMVNTIYRPIWPTTVVHTGPVDVPLKWIMSIHFNGYSAIMIQMFISVP